VGHYAVQIAKAREAYVIGTASGTNEQLVRELGADEVVDYKKVRFEDAVQLPVDLVLDTVGHDTTARSLAVLRAGGTLVSTREEQIPGIQAQARQQGIYAAGFLVRANGRDMRHLAELLTTGQLRSHISLTLPFDRLPDAIRQLDSGSTVGKVVVTI